MGGPEFFTDLASANYEIALAPPRGGPFRATRAALERSSVSCLCRRENPNGLFEGRCQHLRTVLRGQQTHEQKSCLRCGKTSGFENAQISERNTPAESAVSPRPLLRDIETPPRCSRLPHPKDTV